MPIAPSASAETVGPCLPSVRFMQAPSFDECRLDSLDHRRHPREMEMLAQHIQQGGPAVDAYRVRHAVDGQAACHGLNWDRSRRQTIRVAALTSDSTLSAMWM